MATYIPKSLVAPTALTASAATYYTAPGSTTGMARTIHVSTSASGKTFTLSIGADAAGTRLWDAYALTANVPSIWNGQWIIPTGVVIQAKATDTVPVLHIGGYEAT